MASRRLNIHAACTELSLAQNGGINGQANKHWRIGAGGGEHWPDSRSVCKLWLVETLLTPEHLSLSSLLIQPQSYIDANLVSSTPRPYVATHHTRIGFTFDCLTNYTVVGKSGDVLDMPVILTPTHTKPGQNTRAQSHKPFSAMSILRLHLFVLVRTRY